MEGSEKAVRNYVHKLSFRAGDAVLSARYGFNARNILVFFRGLTAAWLVWVIFIYLGFYAAGDSIAERFSTSLFCPLPDALFLNSSSALVLMAAGGLLSLFIFMSTSLKVSRLTFEQLRGDQFYSAGDARKFCEANWKPLLMTPVTILSGIALGIAVVSLLGIAGRIPGAGPVIAGLFAVPGVVLGVFMVLAIVALVLSVFLVPSITGTTGGDTFECLFELFSIVTSRPFRLFRGILAGVAMRVVALATLLFFIWGAVSLFGGVLDSVSGFSGTSTALGSGFSRAAPDLVPFYSSILGPVASASHGEGTWTGFPGMLIAASGTAIFLFLASYWYSSCTAMWTIIYLGARHSRDGEDLLLRAEEEEYREFRRVYGSTDNGGDRQDK